MRKIVYAHIILGLIIITNLTVLGAKNKHPNVIIIMTDDQGNNLGCLGNPWLKTPNIDKFNNQAVRFSNYHQELMCTPSRAALLTGKYAVRTGAWRTSVGRSIMRTEELAMAEIFRENGYKTAHFGKWHLGDEWPYRPQDQGFDEVVGHKCGGVSQISDYWGNDYFDDTYYHNGVPKQYKGYCTDVFFNETIRFIDENKEKPFMIYLATNAAHVPNVVAEEYSKPYLDMGIEKGQAVYYGMISNIDDNMGGLMQYLKDGQLEENTLVIFMTDDGPQNNGQQFDEDGWALDHGFNAGQRGGKGSVYEGGHRLFSMWRWPAGNLIGGKVIDDMVTGMDILPTLIDMFDLNVSVDTDFDGVSFKPILYNLEENQYENRTIILTKFGPGRPATDPKQKTIVMQGDWRLINRKELYNVKHDLAQKNNVNDSNLKLAKELEQVLDEWIKINTQRMNEPVRHIIGDERAPIMHLTTQDLYGSSVYSQKQVGKLQTSEAPWKVSFVQDGKYRFILSRFPLYTNMPFNEAADKKKKLTFNANHAKLSVGNLVDEKAISATDTHVTFEMQIKAGDYDMQTWIRSDEKTIPAYFVEVELLD